MKNEICVEFVHGRKNKCKTMFKGAVNKVLVSGLVLASVMGTTSPAFAAESKLMDEYRNNVVQEYGISVEDSIKEVQNTIAAIESMKAKGSITTSQIQALAKQLYALEGAVKSSGKGASAEVVSVLEKAEKAIKGLSGVKDVEIAIAIVKADLGVDTQTVSNSFAALKSFDDVPSNFWAHDYIMLCVQHGAIAGTRTPDANGVGSFNPNGQVTLGQFLAVITRLVATDKIAGDTSVHWSVPYYNAAVQSGVIKASDFECTPGALNSSLSREDMALILVNAAKVNGESMQTLAGVENMMKDYNSISYDRRDAVMKAYSNGLLAGDTVGKFNPHNTMTRAQMATVVCRLMEYAPRGSVSVPVKVDVNEYVSNEGDTKGMLLPKFSREYETKALQAVRTGEDSKGVYVTFTAPELPTDIKGDFTFSFAATVYKSNGDYFADGIYADLKAGESKKVYFVSYQDTGVKSSQIGTMSVGVMVDNSEHKHMFVRSIYSNDKTTAYGTWYDGAQDNSSLNSSIVWAGIEK